LTEDVDTAVEATTETWHLGSRVSRVRASHSFGIVLLLIFASFVCASALPDRVGTTAALLLLEGMTLVIAVWTSGVAGLGSTFNLVLFALTAAVAVALLISGTTGLQATAGILSGVLSVLTVGVIGLGVADQTEVNAQSVTGAICVYLLLGLAFTFVYGALAALGSGPFFTSGTDGTLAIRLYFSYVTLATVGYGDYTARTNFGHMLAVIEALAGQLYLVTVVALLVARMRPRGGS